MTMRRSKFPEFGQRETRLHSVQLKPLISPYKLSNRTKEVEAI